LKIQYFNKKNTRSRNDGPFYALTIFHSNWGNLNLPTRVIDQDDLQEKFGYPSDDTNFNLWMQAWNFLEYSQNLKIFRVGKREPVSTFDISGDLISVTGAGNAMTFFNSRSSAITTATSVWNSAINGSDIYYTLNDVFIPQNEPIFDTTQLLFVSAKYPGTLGNEIGISIANSDADYDSSYVFRFDHANVADSTPFSIGDNFTGATTSAIAEVKQIIDNTIYFDVIEGTFSAGETLNINSTAITTISAIISGDDVDDKVCFNQLFTKYLSEKEIAVVITVNNKVEEYFTASLERSLDNFIEDVDSKWVNFLVSEDYVDPDDVAVALKNNYKVWNVVNEKLQFGVSDIPTNSEIETQVDILKGKTFGRFEICFTENSDIVGKLSDDILNFERLLVYNKNEVTI